MSWSDAIHYAEAIGKAIWNYFGLSDYLKLKVSASRNGMAHYEDVHELWTNVISGDTYEDGDLRLKRGSVVKLIDFTFTEWFPWLPGMYWSPYGMPNRFMGDSDAGVLTSESMYMSSTDATLDKHTGYSIPVP
jgi:hypothetical protein